MVDKLNPDDIDNQSAPVPAPPAPLPGAPEELPSPIPPLEVKPEQMEMIKVFKQLLGEALEPFREDLKDQRGRLDGTIVAFNDLVKQLNGNQQQPQTQQQTGAAGEFMSMAPEAKQKAGMEFITTLIDAYSKIKGVPTGDPSSQGFEKMMAEWGGQMFKYHLDNMAQSVYGISLPPPSNLTQRPPPQQISQPQEHKFE